MRTHAGDGPPLEDNVALGGFINPGHTIDQGRFSGAVGSNQGHYLMFIDIKADILNDNQTTKSH